MTTSSLDGSHATGIFYHKTRPARAVLPTQEQGRRNTTEKIPTSDLPNERALIKARQGVELLTSGELRVVDTDGREVPSDGQTVGEIVVRGNVVMEGYYHDPEATTPAMGDGWFHTGDAAVVHVDGYAEIRDRLKDAPNLTRQ